MDIPFRTLKPRFIALKSPLMAFINVTEPADSVHLPSLYSLPRCINSPRPFPLHHSPPPLHAPRLPMWRENSSPNSLAAARRRRCPRRGSHREPGPHSTRHLFILPVHSYCIFSSLVFHTRRLTRTSAWCRRPYSRPPPSQWVSAEEHHAIFSMKRWTMSDSFPSPGITHRRRHLQPSRRIR
jgi:hypothetical protein